MRTKVNGQSYRTDIFISFFLKKKEFYKNGWKWSGGHRRLRGDVFSLVEVLAWAQWPFSKNIFKSIQK